MEEEVPLEQHWVALQAENANLQAQVTQLLAQQQLTQQQLAQQQAIAGEPVAVHVVEDGDDPEGKKILKFLKLKFERFNGHSNAKRDPGDWIYQLENAFEALGIQEDATKLKAIKHVLDDTASRWWRSLNEGSGVVPIATFAQFKDDLFKRFRPQDPAHVAQDKLDDFKQKGSVSNYADRFSILALESKLSDIDLQHRFIKGLKPNVRDKVKLEQNLKRLKDLEAVVEFAVAVDNSFYNNSERDNGSGSRWKGQHGGQASGSSQAYHPPTGVAPMDVDAFKHLPRLTDKTRAECDAQGRCRTCQAVRSDDLSGILLPEEQVEQQPRAIDVDLGPLVAVWKDALSAKLLVTKGRLGCGDAETLFDTGCSVTLVSAKFVLKHKLKTRTIINGPTFRTADGRNCRCDKVLETARFSAGPYQDTLTNVVVIPGDCPFDLILGKPWFDEKNPEIDFPNNFLSLEHNGEKISFRADYYDKKLLRDNGIISALEMYGEFSLGNTINMCLLKPIPDDYENYECNDAGEKLEKKGLEKYVDEVVTKLYDDYKDVFKPDLGVPVDREVEHEIELEPGASPVAQQMYRLSFEELAELKKQILEYLRLGFIRPSKSPYGAPILFVRKKSGAMRMCVDYRGLNRITKKNRCPLPRIDELLDRLVGAKYFTSLDLRSGYHQIKIKEEDIEKTAFRTQYGHFEFIVLPFGLCNAPATFQTLMNNIFRDVLDQFVLVYLDDIMIFSKTLKEHEQHVEYVLQKLREKSLFVNKEKCAFFRTKIAWVGYVISGEGIEVDQSKISTILEWPIPKNTIEILSFLGFTGWYRKFIEKYSHIAAPMTELLKKDVPFIWSTPQQQSFDLLKEKLTNAPILILPSPDFPFKMYTDASDFAIGGVLMQDQGQGLRPVAYSSKKLNEAQKNYTIYEKEALSQIHHLQLWRCYIQSANRSTAFTDNTVLKNLQTQARLSPRQARWMQILQEYNVYVDYIAGKANVVADALSRRPDFAMTVVIACQDSDWLFRLKESYKESSDTKKIIKLIQDGTSRDYAFDHGYIVRRTPSNIQLYIPDVDTMRRDLLVEHHDSLLAGHFGAAKTAALLSRCYYWPGQQRDVRKFVQRCERCAESKSSNQKTPGLLKYLPIPRRSFEVITMDFVTNLPEADGFTAIMIMVDKLTKRVFLAPTTDAVDAEEAATLFYQHVVRNQGVPSVIISDRGTQFTSVFWKSMVAQLGIKHKLSTAYHPQTDGQSEITVRIVIDMLRTLHQEYKNWAQILPAVEFAINNSKNISTGQTPFFLCYGEEVPTPPTINLKALAKTNPNQPSVDFAERTQVAIQRAQQSLARAQQKQKFYADKKRRYLTFEEGEQVYISTADLPLKGPRKLAPKWFGPVPIIKKLSDLNYQVALPEAWKRRYPVFHIEKLKPFFPSDQYPGRFDTRPPPDLEEGSDVYNVEKILHRRSTPWGRGFKVEYYIKWEGYPSCDSTWELKTNLRDAGTEVQRMMRELDQQSVNK